jgi:hypothetical protein
LGQLTLIKNENLHWDNVIGTTLVANFYQL